MSPHPVHIHYHRPPTRTDVYVQELVLDAPDVKVTYQPSTPLRDPIHVEGTLILEPGSPAVWFTFPGAWHDIGRFHDQSGRFTGIYANVLTPCRLHSGAELREQSSGDPPPILRWDTTDLFLDVWLGADGSVRLLDEEDLDRAEAEGTVDAPTAKTARDEAQRILRELAAGSWPPPIVEEWTLERVRYSLSPRS